MDPERSDPAAHPAEHGHRRVGHLSVPLVMLANGVPLRFNMLSLLLGAPLEHIPKTLHSHTHIYVLYLSPRQFFLGSTSGVPALRAEFTLPHPS